MITVGDPAHVPFLDLIGQYATISTEIESAIHGVISSASFIGGEPASRFEHQFSEYLGTTNCVGVGNGTDALEIALTVLNLPQGSEVIVPANSFVATAEAVTRSGLRPVFADVDDTYTLDLDSVEEAISPRTSAVIAVHLYGHPCHMDGILSLAEQHGLRVIEDCAQAHGATVGGRKVGSIGHAAAFSFYPGKNLGAYGDGGAVTFRDDIMAERARMLANHGRMNKYDHEFVGRNSRLDGLQAAILSVKLPYLDSWLERRRVIASRYRTRLADCCAVMLGSRGSDVEHAYHLFVLRTPFRNELIDFLTDNNVATGIHYPVAIPALQAYRTEHLQSCQDMRAVQWAEQVVSIPCHEMLTDEQVDHVVELLCDFNERHDSSRS